MSVVSISYSRSPSISSSAQAVWNVDEGENRIDFRTASLQSSMKLAHGLPGVAYTRAIIASI